MTTLPYTLPSLLPGEEGTVYVPDTSDSGGSDGSITGIADLCAEAQALIIAQYRESPRLLALLCSYLDRIQAADQGLAALYQYATNIEEGLGDQLDLIGRIVRESREGRDDDAYRRALRVRILVNRSQGRIEDLIGIASLFEDDAPIRLREYQPAREVVTVLAPAVNASAALSARLQRAKAAGVALQTVTHPTPPTASRIFSLGAGAASVDKAEILTGLGWTGDDRGGHTGHALAT